MNAEISKPTFHFLKFFYYLNTIIIQLIFFFKEEYEPKLIEEFNDIKYNIQRFFTKKNQENKDK